MKPVAKRTIKSLTDCWILCVGDACLHSCVRMGAREQSPSSMSRELENARIKCANLFGTDSEGSEVCELRVWNRMLRQVLREGGGERDRACARMEEIGALERVGVRHA